MSQVVNLHYMLSKTVVKARPSVLWCYKKDLHLSSHRKKRVRQIQKMAQRGLLDPEAEDPFSLFVASTSIRYCYYSETHKVLGNTYGMLVLQDFEALTPNLLARTVETVEGGGVVVLLLSSLDSLTSLYSLTMDVHARLRTESHQEVVGRFNERMVLSLAGCPGCILMDDELNILPTSTHVRGIAPLEGGQGGGADGGGATPAAAAAAELKDLAESLADTQPAGALVGRCRTLDQARAVVSFLDAASEKTLRATVALTAARGRGKSAALGLAIAGALGLGYSNIFVTAPSPENLRTLFEFVFKGLDELGYKEHIGEEPARPLLRCFGHCHAGQQAKVLRQLWDGESGWWPPRPRLFTPTRTYSPPPPHASSRLLVSLLPPQTTTWWRAPTPPSGAPWCASTCTAPTARRCSTSSPSTTRGWRRRSCWWSTRRPPSL
jgi:N-acetyltransferase 10